MKRLNHIHVFLLVALFSILTLAAVVTLLRRDELTEEPLARLIREAVGKTMDYPSTYRAVSLQLDSVFADQGLPKAIPLRNQLTVDSLRLEVILKKLHHAQQSMDLWKGPASQRPDRKKYQEAKEFHDAMQAQADSLQHHRDSLAVLLDSVRNKAHTPAGFLARLRFAQITRELDTVLTTRYLLLDSTMTTVIDSWPDNIFNQQQ